MSSGTLYFDAAEQRSQRLCHHVFFKYIHWLIRAPIKLDYISCHCKVTSFWENSVPFTQLKKEWSTITITTLDKHLEHAFGTTSESNIPYLPAFFLQIRNHSTSLYFISLPGEKKTKNQRRNGWLFRSPIMAVFPGSFGWGVPDPLRRRKAELP